MKKLISITVVFAILITAVFSVTAFAATSDYCGDNAKWSFDSSTGTLTVTGTGATYDYTTTIVKRVPWYSNREKITKIEVGEGITELGQLVFYSCTSLESISLPTTLTTIAGGVNSGAFRECTSLKSVTLPINLKTIEAYAFNGCTALTGVNFNENLETIGVSAFKGCSALKAVSFPDSLTSLGDGAFRECTSLSSVTYATGMTSTGTYAFYNSGVSKLTLSSTITKIDAYSFYGTKFTALELPETVSSIGMRAFANCTFLLSATIYNTNCDFGGINIGENSNDPFNGSQQSLKMYGHSGSTTQAYAQAKGYEFVSIDSCEHTTTHEVITVEPTCTKGGKTTQVCDECGFVVSEEELPANGHSYETAETVDATDTDGHTYEYQKCSVCQAENTIITHQAFVDGYYDEKTTATCTVPGVTTKTCKLEGCGKTERTAVAGTGHKIENSTVTKQATCTEAGSQTGICSVCGKEVTQEIPALGHSFSEETETLDNTATDGHTYLVEECTVCGEKVSTPTHIEWVDGNYTSTVISEPRCVVDGVQIDTCTVCNQRRTVTLPANGEHIWTETTRTEPTCTAVGKIYYKCENCELTKSENIEALGHDYQIQTAVEPTCTASGYNTYKCARDGCSSSKKEVVDALGHTLDESTYLLVTEAGCETDGSATGTCSVCAESYDITIAALGHNYVDVDAAIDDKPGHLLRTPTCSRCSKTQESSIIHSEWLDGYYTTEVVTEGDCTTDRVVRDSCSLCSETKDTVTEAVGSHSFVYTGNTEDGKLNYTCSVCSKENTISPLLVYPLWNVNYVNKAPSEITNGYYFELNKDGIINAKDYALLRQAYKNRTAAQNTTKK